MPPDHRSTFEIIFDTEYIFGRSMESELAMISRHHMRRKLKKMFGIYDFLQYLVLWLVLLTARVIASKEGSPYLNAVPPD